VRELIEDGSLQGDAGGGTGVVSGDVERIDLVISRLFNRFDEGVINRSEPVIGGDPPAKVAWQAGGRGS
jgi:hypothetical protein